MLRAQLALVLREVLEGRSLNDALRRGQEKVPSRDRALLAELAYGVCRHYFSLEALAGMLLRQPLKDKDLDVQALLLGGLYQLLHTRIPAHAAIGETAGAARVLRKKWAVGLVNGVLRHFQREQEALLSRLEQMNSRQVRYQLPDWLIGELKKAWPEQAEAVIAGLSLRPPFTIRVNLQRNSLSEYASLLKEAGMTARPLKGIPSALMLDEAVSVEELPGFFQGAVSVQDGGAQLAAFLLDAQPGMTVLDACAAPGGKTGHILEHTRDLQLTAVDFDPGRLERVAQNMARLGFRANLARGDASHPRGAWAEQAYDRILADVPCTATGVIRRHPDIRLLRRPADVQNLQLRQQQILDALWSLLQPGGKMLYATCSLLPQENDEQVERFLLKQPDASAVMLPPGRGMMTTHGLQLLPDTLETDGFYYALLEKRAD
ncbi:16S rRNA (cytosine(967)-C(5))-methyltransferase RsmB [Thiolapillus brandeum]|uniref:16S rRNA (cytosine(967)-C(5))-methyltransferase RsmB n=1 Tax=Thiolapillus brandeum TaxID=1076588 RepID=UPI000597D8A5|nr:16S rRNA (cytosine(967)-C(5))-methyltransferase RsmB [Thiolapillus brandeum]